MIRATMGELPATDTTVILRKGSVIHLDRGRVLEQVPNTSDKYVLYDFLEVSIPVDVAVWAGNTNYVSLNEPVTIQVATDVRVYRTHELDYLRRGLYVVPRGSLVKVLEAAAGSTWDGPVDEPTPTPRDVPGADDVPPPPADVQLPPPAAARKTNWTPWLIAASVVLLAGGGVAIWATRRRRGMRGLGAAGCPRGKVRLTQRQALKLLDWHGGQGTAAYALGSSSFAGHCVNVSVAEDALFDLQHIASARQLPAKDLAHLQGVFAAIRLAIRNAGGVA